MRNKKAKLLKKIAALQTKGLTPVDTQRQYSALKKQYNGCIDIKPR